MIHTTKNIFLLLFFSAFLSACGQSSPTVSEPHRVVSDRSETDDDFNTGSRSSADSLVFELGDSVCESGRCPEWVGSVFSKTPRTATSDTYGLSLIHI